MARYANFAKPALIGAVCLGIVGLAVAVDQVGTDDRAVLEHFTDAEAERRIREAQALQRLGQWDAAFEIFDRYTQRGHPKAMYYLAESYRRGRGTDIDLEKARQLMLRAVQYEFTDRPRAAYALGRLFQRSEGEDCDVFAVAWFTRAAEWGYAKAHVQLAIHYEAGLGVERDLDQATHHYIEAGRAGFENATLRFARMLLSNPENSSENNKLAERLIGPAMAGLRTKANAGGSTAAKFLGQVYSEGLLVPRNMERAEFWFRRSSQLGDGGGMHGLGSLLLAKQESVSSTEEGLGWLRRGAEKGHGGAMTALGRLHLRSVYGLDPTDAVGWFERGIAAGHAGAMAELARLKVEGTLVEKDLPAAIDLARRGAAQGHTGSRTLLKALLDQSETETREG